MKQITILLFIYAFLPAAATDPPGFRWWPASQLRGYEKTLAPKINAQKIASEQLGKFNNHSLVVIHREGNGEAELHEAVADVFIVQSGQATLVVGGKVVGGRATGPGEVRGVSIQGGENRSLGPGDMAHIPANTPHQVLLAPGKQLTYVTVKIEK